jgi:hypothetical protein
LRYYFFSPIFLVLPFSFFFPPVFIFPLQYFFIANLFIVLPDSLDSSPPVQVLPISFSPLSLKISLQYFEFEIGIVPWRHHAIGGSDKRTDVLIKITLPIKCVS